jgi:hypothetical protein
VGFQLYDILEKKQNYIVGEKVAGLQGADLRREG